MPSSFPAWVARWRWAAVETRWLLQYPSFISKGESAPPTGSLTHEIWSSAPALDPGTIFGWWCEIWARKIPSRMDLTRQWQCPVFPLEASLKSRFSPTRSYSRVKTYNPLDWATTTPWTTLPPWGRRLGNGSFRLRVALVVGGW
jgi:hypothetical protein